MDAVPLWRALTALLLVAACTSGPVATTPPASPTDGAVTGEPTAPPTMPVPSDTPATGSPPTGTGEPSPTSGSPQPSALTPAPDAYAWGTLSVNEGPAAREDHTFTLDGVGAYAYLFGGRAGSRTFDDIWRYDLVTDTWTHLSPEGDAPPGRFGHVAAWKDGLGLVVWSGQADADTFFGDIWALQPDGPRWIRLPIAGDVPLARYGSCGGIGPDGRLWISHGFTHDEGRFFDTKAYDFAAGAWTDHTPDGDVPVLRCLHDCLWTPEGEFLLYAGQTTGAPAIGDMWLFDPAASEWTEQPQPPAPPRQLYALAQLDGRGFIFGGAGSSGRPLGDLWLLELTTLNMTEAVPVGEQPAPRSGATLVADPSRGRLLLFGGKGQSGELGDLWQLSHVP